MIGVHPADWVLIQLNENRDNGEPWKSRTDLRLKLPDVLPSGLGCSSAYTATSWSGTCIHASSSRSTPQCNAPCEEKNIPSLLKDPTGPRVATREPRVPIYFWELRTLRCVSRQGLLGKPSTDVVTQRMWRNAKRVGAPRRPNFESNYVVAHRFPNETRILDFESTFRTWALVIQISRLPLFGYLSISERTLYIFPATQGVSG